MYIEISIPQDQTTAPNQKPYFEPLRASTTSLCVVVTTDDRMSNLQKRRASMTTQSLEIASDSEVEADFADTRPSIDDQYLEQREQSKLRHWKESEYAVGLVEPTWADELELSRKNGQCCCCVGEVGQVFQEEIDPGCGCIYFSAVVCSRLGAGRVGNMAVLKERYVWVEEEKGEMDEEDGDACDGFVGDEQAFHKRKTAETSGTASENSSSKRLIRKREIQLIVGPFWPMLLFITYPLIFGVSFFTLKNAIPSKPIPLQIVWGVLTISLIRSLFNTGFRDPGIMKRYKNPPQVDTSEEEDVDDDTRRRIAFRWHSKSPAWRWSDQAQSYRPRNSVYDPDCKCIIEEFDHT